LIKRLSALQGVAGIYGTGSYFSDQALLGHSDIDLLILLEDRESSGILLRSIYQSYRVLHRFFPFLGNWEEQRDNIILMSELRSGDPKARSARVRSAMGQLTHVWGISFPENGQCSDIAYLSEVDVLLRSAFLAARTHGYQAIFWQRHFRRLAKLADQLGLDASRAAIEAVEQEFDLLSRPRDLFFRHVDPNVFYERLILLASNCFSEFGSRELSRGEAAQIEIKERGSFEPQQELKQLRLDRVLEMSELGDFDTSVHAPTALSYSPRMFYSRIDEPILQVSITGKILSKLARLKKNLRKHGRSGDVIFVRAADFIFVLFRDESFVDVQVLNPLLHARVYARLDSTVGLEQAASIYRGLCAEADLDFAKMASSYEENTNSVTKEPYACLYIDDDLEVIRDAYHILRAYFLRNEYCLEFLDTRSLSEQLAIDHPRSAEFIAELLKYYSQLIGRTEEKPSSRNLYRILHVFMQQVLSGTKDIAVDSLLRTKLSLSVGVITRNRCDDLRELLQSLQNQSRQADEVLVVDNASSDETKQVVESFEGLLPIRYEYYGTPSIPQARNTVLSRSTGDIIAFTDDDCVVSKDWLYAVERAFLRYDSVGIVGGEVHHYSRNRQASAVDRYYEMFHNIKA
jgi:hypothetical protein